MRYVDVSVSPYTLVQQRPSWTAPCLMNFVRVDGVGNWERAYYWIASTVAERISIFMSNMCRRCSFAADEQCGALISNWGQPTQVPDASWHPNAHFIAPLLCIMMVLSHIRRDYWRSSYRWCELHVLIVGIFEVDLVSSKESDVRSNTRHVRRTLRWTL